MLKKTLITGFWLLLIVLAGCQDTFTQTAIRVKLSVCDGDRCLINEMTDENRQPEKLMASIDNLPDVPLTVSWYRDGWQQPLKVEQTSQSTDFYLDRPDFGWVQGWYSVTIGDGGQNETAKIWLTGQEKKKMIYNKYHEWREYDKNNQDNLSIDVLNGQRAELISAKIVEFMPYGHKLINTDKWDKDIAVNLCRELTDGTCVASERYFINEDQQIFLHVTNAENRTVFLYWEGLEGSELIDLFKTENGELTLDLKNISWPSGVYWTEFLNENGDLVKIHTWQVLPADSGLISGREEDGFYTCRGDWVAVDGSGLVDEFKTNHDWQERIKYEYVEDGTSDEYGNYTLMDGTGFYDRTGNFWFWREIYGEGKYNGEGGYDVGGGYIDVEGNYFDNVQ